MENKPVNILNEDDFNFWFTKLLNRDCARTPISTANIKDATFIKSNRDAVAHMMTHRYIKKKIRVHLNKFIGQDFLTPVGYHEDLPEPIQTSIQAGSQVYKFHILRVPARLQIDVMMADKQLFQAAQEHIDNLPDTGIDFGHLERLFPTLESAVPEIAKRPPTKIELTPETIARIAQLRAKIEHN